MPVCQTDPDALQQATRLRNLASIEVYMGGVRGEGREASEVIEMMGDDFSDFVVTGILARKK
jgi:hypothetical protein